VPSGTVKWFDLGKGFGFIVPDGGEPSMRRRILRRASSGVMVSHRAVVPAGDYILIARSGCARRDPSFVA
jgi:hypothetical protein